MTFLWHAYSKFISLCCASRLRAVACCCFKSQTKLNCFISVKVIFKIKWNKCAAACSRASGRAPSSFAKQKASGWRSFPPTPKRCIRNLHWNTVTSNNHHLKSSKTFYSLLHMRPFFLGRCILCHFPLHIFSTPAGLHLQTVIVVLMDLGKRGLQTTVCLLAVWQSKTVEDTVHLRTQLKFIYFSGNQQLSPSQELRT